MNTGSEQKKSEKLVYENLELLVDNKKVMIEGKEIAFTKKEFEILKLFLENINRLFTRDEILSRVWTDDVVVLEPNNRCEHYKAAKKN